MGTGRSKMTVEMDGRQRVYGTVPAAILDALTGGVISGGDAPRDEQLKGRRVRFTATVEVSDNDPAFGFYSRPSKASLVEHRRIFDALCTGGDEQSDVHATHDAQVPAVLAVTGG